jgi:hypothetical protein
MTGADSEGAAEAVGMAARGTDIGPTHHNLLQWQSCPAVGACKAWQKCWRLTVSKAFSLLIVMVGVSATKRDITAASPCMQANHTVLHCCKLMAAARHADVLLQSCLSSNTL